MKRFLILAALAFSVCALLLFAPFERAQLPAQQVPAAPQQAAVPAQTVRAEQAPEAVCFDESVTLRVLSDGAIESMSLQEYLLGVLPAEMPTDFPAEALKAQAVASRTFALKQAHSHKHLGADICAQAACCQGRLSPDELSAEQRERVLLAITQTDGLVVAYDDELIDATFFSCSGGKTEAAAAVWGGDVPYLQSVDSPNEDAPYHTDTLRISTEEFSEKFSAAYPQAVLPDNPHEWFSELSYSDGGGLALLSVGGVLLRGTQLRSLLQLRSTAVEISVTQDELCFTTRGYGHRVGMSQYGAKAMAQAGCRFDEILSHYYQGTALRRLYLTGTAEISAQQ